MRNARALAGLRLKLPDQLQFRFFGHIIPTMKYHALHRILAFNYNAVAHNLAGFESCWFESFKPSDRRIASRRDRLAMGLQRHGIDEP